MSDQKIEIAEKIVQMIQRYNEFFEAIESFFRFMVMPNKNVIINKLLAFKSANWDAKITSIEQDIDSFKVILHKNNILIEKYKNMSHVQAMSMQYLQLINTEFSNEEGTLLICAQESKKLTSNFKTIGQNTNEFVMTKYELNSFIEILEFQQGFANRYLNKLALLDNIEHVKDIEHSAVIIGANGSGKSSFSRNARRILSDNVIIISAQKIFNFQSMENVPIGDAALLEVQKFQAHDKLGRSEKSSKYDSDLNNLICALIAEHQTCAITFFEESENIVTKPVKKKSVLEKVINVWNQIITHRKMKFVWPKLIISLIDGSSDYEFSSLSDGEKAIFYYTAHVLLARENAFIIVDEPENHLHMSLVPKLWDRLEYLREDCKFIYLTHNLDFASTRIKAKKLWIKKFKSPATWEVEPLPLDDTLPEALIMEMLGSRGKILFCEGQKSSPDFQLYSLLFPDFDIKPVGNHTEVINFTRAYNRAKNFFGNIAIGIIDGDFHPLEAKISWQKDDIYCIDAQEVENLLVDEILLNAAKEKYDAQLTSLEKAKTALFDMLEKQKNSYAIEYASQNINIILKGNLIGNEKTISELNEKYLAATKSVDPDKLYQERISFFEKIIATKDFENGVKHFNNKGLVGIIGNKIVNDYKSRIFQLLKKDDNLLQKLRYKYFKHINVSGRNF